jgi:hypothetical protein
MDTVIIFISLILVAAGTWRLSIDNMMIGLLVILGGVHVCVTYKLLDKKITIIIYTIITIGVIIGAILRCITRHGNSTRPQKWPARPVRGIPLEDFL